MQNMHFIMNGAAYDSKFIRLLCKFYNDGCAGQKRNQRTGSISPHYLLHFYGLLSGGRNCHRLYTALLSWTVTGGRHRSFDCSIYLHLWKPHSDRACTVEYHSACFFHFAGSVCWFWHGFSFADFFEYSSDLF